MSDEPGKLDISDEMIAERRGGSGKMPDDMPLWMAKSITSIDKFSKWIGNIVCWILMPLIFAMTYEVLARKLFLAPTIWAYDISRFLYGALFMLGAIIFSIFIFFNWVPLEKNIFWLYLVILGVAGFVSHSLIIYAIQLSNLSFVTNFQYSQLVWSTIINFLIFGVPFDYNKIVGVIGIIVFGIMFIRTEGKKS